MQKLVQRLTVSKYLEIQEQHSSILFSMWPLTTIEYCGKILQDYLTCI